MRKLSLMLLFATLCCFAANAQTPPGPPGISVYNKHFYQPGWGVTTVYESTQFTTDSDTDGVTFYAVRNGTLVFSGTYTHGSNTVSFGPITLEPQLYNLPPASDDEWNMAFKTYTIQVKGVSNWKVDMQVTSRTEKPMYPSGTSEVGFNVYIQKWRLP